MQTFQSFMDSDWTSSATSDPASSLTNGSTLTLFPSGIAISSSYERALGCWHLFLPAGTSLDNRVTTDALMGTDDVASTPCIFSVQVSHGLPIGASLPMAPEQHRVVQIGPFTSQADLKRYIILTQENSNTYFTCDYPACSHEGAFDSRRQTASHVRRVHLMEKPFKCTTCGKYFAYQQDANRHVNTMNRGKIHECTICHKRYARKDYCDRHVIHCLRKTGEKSGSDRKI
ncbi:hypothetical protein JB92DRAFT_795594 [Gautieria morchelliformis]|nr:hypothetical protein JB92DRAFT_795594 [Gautieria morchelliformis]